MDGLSLVPILKGSSDPIQDYAASIYPRNGFWGIAIRTRRYRYVTWYKGANHKAWHGIRLANRPEFTELYDYEKDPLERKNLSGDPAYADTEKKLAELNRQQVAFTQSKQFKTND